MTYMVQTCCSTNLSSLLQNYKVQAVMGKLVAIYDDVYHEDRWTKEGKKTVKDSFMTIKHLEELSDLSAVKDPYCHFSLVDGKLFYDAYLQDIEVIRPSHITDIGEKCVHMLSFDKKRVTEADREVATHQI
ncbi:uncharacterized protein LAESUDRAFT_718125 [Laetiporus sulphureus 93-53]|uniref:Uncharacterized protein n=1 Tax=Laetiporus sulphureus 93-53 TaxID=1314785 RepID=A0A165B807_9APHY|nr:uncharacterized protein LAESUDRAFT_718125 [Laetiporus sulphureus 93-53]KZT00456.1 hypothetical protein LAESUDRAFT_718125 [Laetiporus sulphureus 93-53]